ncbi:hypothetical protein ACKWRH_25345 [Bradyrhizobium sp. Pa8]|uniref:hypothetical protein n=1 Tax=Bradyrhizobium sp. Pa8 TaxID=3386552 RepID=UPI00403FB3D8
MSALNIICQPRYGAITMATDAASYDENGVVVAFSPKIFPVPAWPGAISGRGATWAVDFAKVQLSECPTFDDAVARSGEILRSISGAFEIVLTGFSKTRRSPEAWFVRTAGGPAGPDYPDPYEPLLMPPVAVGPRLSENVDIDINADPKTVAKALRKVLEIQRHCRHGDSTWYSIGGYGQIARITPEAIEMRLLQRWPEDRVGELILPAPIEWSIWNRINGFAA